MALNVSNLYSVYYRLAVVGLHGFNTVSNLFNIVILYSTSAHVLCCCYC